MYEYDDEVLNYFLENQQQLFPECLTHASRTKHSI